MISIAIPNLLWTVIAVIILYFIIYNKSYIDIFSSPVVNTRSGIDFNLYSVRDSPDHESNTNAANRLATINKEVDRLVEYMKKNEIPDKETADRLFYRWENCELKETPIDDTHIAFTIDKGAAIHMCVRDPEQNLQDYNVGMFVVLHELAHVMSKTKDHTEEFKTNFNQLLKIASKINVYKPIDFKKEPKTYCGTIINTI